MGGDGLGGVGGGGGSCAVDVPFGVAGWGVQRRGAQSMRLWIGGRGSAIWEALPTPPPAGAGSRGPPGFKPPAARP